MNKISALKIACKDTIFLEMTKKAWTTVLRQPHKKLPVAVATSHPTKFPFHQVLCVSNANILYLCTLILNLVPMKKKRVFHIILIVAGISLMSWLLFYLVWFLSLRPLAPWARQGEPSGRADLLAAVSATAQRAFRRHHPREHCTRSDWRTRKCAARLPAKRCGLKRTATAMR